MTDVDRLRAAIDRAEEIALPAVSGCVHFDVCDDAAREFYTDFHVPAHVLRTVAAHRKIVERYETAVIARDAAVDTPLAGATRMALRLARESLEIVAAVYFPEAEQ